MREYEIEETLLVRALRNCIDRYFSNNKIIRFVTFRQTLYPKKISLVKLVTW